MYKKVLMSGAIISIATTSAMAGGMVFDDYTPEREERKERHVYKNEVVEIEVEEEEEAENYWELMIFGGAATMDIDPTIRVTPSETNRLSQENGSQLDSWTAQLGVGYVIPLFDSERFSDEIQWLPAIEPQINVYYLSGDNKGDVYFDSSNDFDVADYKMRIDSTRLMFDLGVTLASYRNFSVYGLAGIGPSWNDIDYSATPNANGEDCGVGHVSADSNSTNFAYEFAAGITYDLNDDFGVSLQYLFAGFSDVEVEDSGLKSSDIDLHSNSIMLGLRWDVF